MASPGSKCRNAAALFVLSLQIGLSRLQAVLSAMEQLFHVSAQQRDNGTLPVLR